MQVTKDVLMVISTKMTWLNALIVQIVPVLLMPRLNMLEVVELPAVLQWPVVELPCPVAAPRWVAVPQQVVVAA